MLAAVGIPRAVARGGLVLVLENDGGNLVPKSDASRNALRGQVVLCDMSESQLGWVAKFC